MKPEDPASGPRAAAQLGVRFLTARGVPPDPVRGVVLIEKAARAGDAEAAFLAATLASTSLWRARDWDTAFDLLLQASNRGHGPARDSLRILAGGPAGEMVEGEDWAGMRAGIDLAQWLMPPTLRTISESPNVQVIERFAPPALCDWLVARARDRLIRATIYDQVTGGVTEDGRRTNSQCDLDVEASGVLTFLLRARIGAMTGRPELAMEVPKVLHYKPGETFARHCDYLDPAQPAYARELALRGQRTHTFLVYLNEGFSGGETRFSRIDLDFRGGQGDALLFANVTAGGQPDGDTEHAGLPPESGEKWVFSQWIREMPVS